MSDVFISYARSDREEAKAIAEVITRAGYDVWWDVNLLPGDKFADEISAVIDKSKAVIVLWTPEATESDWVKAECSVALKKGLLLPVWLNKTNLPLPFNSVHTLDLTNWRESRDANALSPLLTAVRKKIGAPDIPANSRTDEEVAQVLEKPVHELEFWLSVSERIPQSAEEYQIYLKNYGSNAIFADLAHVRINGLSTALPNDNDATISIFGVTVPVSRPIAVVVLPLILMVVLVFKYDELCERFPALPYCAPPYACLLPKSTIAIGDERRLLGDSILELEALNTERFPRGGRFKLTVGTDPPTHPFFALNQKETIVIRDRAYIARVSDMSIDSLSVSICSEDGDKIVPE